MAAASSSASLYSLVPAEASISNTHQNEIPGSRIVNRLVSYNGFRKCSSQKCELNLQTSYRCPAARQYRSVSVMASAGSSSPSLNSLPLHNFINIDGKIIPSVEPNTQATVFAVLDKNKKVQYIGFSKDIRNSLRILMGRRPEHCYHYKLYNLPALDQEKMLQTRQQWIDELGDAPTGNSDPTQKKFWEQPVESGSISERGRAAAAKAKAKTLQQMFVDRGIREQLVYDPALLEQGKCDILPEKFSPDETPSEASVRKADTSLKRKSCAIKAPSGGLVEYDILYEMKYRTNGGWMYDIAVTKDDELTRHRVIVGKFFPDAVKIPEDDFLEITMGFLLNKKIPRHTEGLLDTVTFPINYFAITEVCQFFKDFDSWFPSKLPDDFWRFQRTELYGAAIDPPPPVGPDDDIIPLSVSRRQQASSSA